MTKNRRFLLGLVLILAFGTVSSFASGLSIYEQGSKASAQAGAFVARADDGSAIYYNPAGIAFLDKTELTFNTTIIEPSIHYKSPSLGIYKEQEDLFIIPSFYYTQKFTDMFHFGIGVYSPYNLATSWRDNFPGRFVSRKAKIVTIAISPTFAFKFNDNNAVAFEINYYKARIDMIRTLDTSSFSHALGDGHSEGSLDAHLSDDAIGFSLGYIGKFAPFSYGFAYHSKATLNLNGHASFEASPLIGPFSTLFPGQDIDFKLKLPQNAAAGVAYIKDPFTIEFNLTWTDWSVWDSTDVNFHNETSFFGSPVVADETILFDWNDTWSYRLGLGYKLSDEWELRGGLLYDEAPVPDKTLSPILPDANRWSLQIGTGYKKASISVDTYLMYLNFQNAKINSTNIFRYNYNGIKIYPMTPDGKYTGRAWLGGFQVAYRF